MDNHQKSKHPEVNPDENSKVDNEVNPEENSKVDQEINSEVNTPSSIPDNRHYECIICEIRFAHRRDLMKHMEVSVHMIAMYVTSSSIKGLF